MNSLSTAVMIRGYKLSPTTEQHHQSKYLYWTHSNTVVSQINVIKKQQMSRVNSLYQSKLTTESQRTNAFSQSSVNSQGKPSQISHIIECPICTESIRHSHMCPWCCKLFCEACIKNYVKNRKQECPNCFKALNSSNLLNCSMLGRQIEQALSKSVSKIKNNSNSTSVMVSPSGTKIVFPKPPTPNFESPFAKEAELACERHQLKLEYFCEQCLVGMCSDCAVLSKNHTGHKICKFAQKKLKFKELRLELEAEVSQRKSKLSRERDQLKQYVDRSPTIENEKQTILSSYLNHLAAKNSQLHDQAFDFQANSYRNCQAVYINQIDKLDSLSKDIEKQAKAALVRNSFLIEKQLVDALRTCRIQPRCISKTIEGFIVPEYEQKTYILEDYNYLRLKGDILISEPLFIRSTEWRLKIFPAGLNRTGEDKHLSIHLQMSKGFANFNWYRFRIELVNQTNRSKCMSIEFDNEFKEGSEQCIDNFILTSKLYEENFIHPELGHIQIVLYVRCMTYYHAIRDQNQLIRSKESKTVRNIQVIANLKKEAAAKGLKLQTQIVSPNRFGRDHQLSASNNSPTRRVIAIDADE